MKHDEKDEKAVAAGTYGDSKNVPQVTVNKSGVITAIKNVPIAFPPPSGGGGGAVPVQSFGIEIGDGINNITTGYKGMYVAHFNGTLIGWTAIVCDPNMSPGTIVIDVLKTPFDQFPQSAGQPVAGANKPSITSGVKGSGGCLGWVVDVKVGDVFIFDVPDVSGVKKVLLQLRADQVG